MGYSNFFFFRQIYYILKRSKRFRILLLTLIILFVFYKVCFGVQLEGVTGIEQNLIDGQFALQDLFVYHCLPAFYNNNSYWTDELEPMIQAIGTSHDVYIRYINSLNDTRFYIYVFNYSDSSNTTTQLYTNPVDGQNYDVRYRIFSSSQFTCYMVYWDKINDIGTVEVFPYSTSYAIPYCLCYRKSNVFNEFINTVITGNADRNSIIFNSILAQLNNISSLNQDIIDSLSVLASSLNTISSNTSTNYSQQISAISGKIDDILDDNQEIISQNDEMIQQQEQINQNLEQTNENLEELNDTLTDDTVESTASDLPSTNVSDPSETGIATIFQSIYNAFCTGTAQDIVFPIPFTNKNITLSPYYVSDMLNNNSAGWVYTLIQAFWGYLIGRFIVSDISKKIDKVKSGNIENIENNNIKEEML